MKNSTIINLVYNIFLIFCMPQFPGSKSRYCFVIKEPMFKPMNKMDEYWN